MIAKSGKTLEESLIAAQESERTLITNCWVSVEDMMWLRGMRVDDFTDPGAKAAFRAMRTIQARGDDVHLLTIQRQMAKDGEAELFQSMTASWNETRFSVLLKSQIKSLVSDIKREACLRRVRLAAHQIVALTHEDSFDVLSLQEQATKTMTKAFSSVQNLDATPERDVLLDMAGHMADCEMRKLQGDTSGGELMTPFADLDEDFGGGGAEQVIVIAARPSVGKSALALQIAREWGRFGEIYYWSGEMSKRALAVRAACQHFQKSDKEIRASGLYQMSEEHSANVYYDTEGGMTIEKLAAKCELFKMQHPKMKAVVIDYLGLACGTGYDPVSEASKAVLSLAKSLGVCILLLVQLSRKLEDRIDKTPILSDLRDSGQIEQDAFKVLMIHRPVLHDKTADPNYAELWLRKHREGPRDVRIKVSWNGETRSFGRWSGDSKSSRKPTWADQVPMEDFYK